MYYHTVKPELMTALRKLMLLPSLKDFILVGGTNLTLQRGHRKTFADKKIFGMFMNYCQSSR